MELNKHKLMFFALSHLIKCILSQCLIFCHSTSLFRLPVQSERGGFSFDHAWSVTAADGQCSHTPPAPSCPSPPYPDPCISSSPENLQGLPIARGPGLDLEQQDVRNHPEPSHCGGSHRVGERGGRPAGHQHEGQRRGGRRGRLEGPGLDPITNACP